MSIKIPYFFGNYFFFFLQEIYKDRKKFSKEVFEVASSDLVNMGITVVSYTLKDIRDEEVGLFILFLFKNCSLASRIGIENSFFLLN